MWPRWVKTGLGQDLADSLGVKTPPMSADESATGCIQQIDAFNLESSGKFVGVDGKELPW